MSIGSLEQLNRAMRAQEVEALYVKPLAENDNSKQGIYIQGGFETIQHLPVTEINKSPRSDALWANVAFGWMDDAGRVDPAPRTKLILYGKYPEVRFSGFLDGCETAPRKLLQPIPRKQRRSNNAPDGRMLFLGVTKTKRIVAYLAAAATTLSRAARALLDSQPPLRLGVFYRLPPPSAIDSRAELIQRLRVLHAGGKIDSSILRAGVVSAYSSRSPNAAGYTLEAALGIEPNGRSEPDFMGWEVKSYSKSLISLMTPEPDGGFYKTDGIKAFVRRYGSKHRTKPKSVFTGRHKVGVRLPRTKTVLQLNGYDPSTGRVDLLGAVELIDDTGDIAASWSFAKLAESWSKKHARAVYVPRISVDAPPPPGFKYQSPVLMGEGTNFKRLLMAMYSQNVFYDPGNELDNTTNLSKRRNQFRVSAANLSALYTTFSSVAL